METATFGSHAPPAHRPLPEHVPLADRERLADRHPSPLRAHRALWARRVSIAGGIAAAGVGLIVLVGWALGIRALESVTPHAVSMKPNTALAFALGGTALVRLATRAQAGRRAGLLVGALIAGVAAIALLTVLEYALGVDLGIDQLLFREPLRAVQTVVPGRMALVTAICFLATAAALALVSLGSATLQQVAASALLAFALAVLLGYLYGIELANPSGSTTVAAQTVAAFLALGTGLLLARPEEGPVGALLGDEPGALMARWLLPYALVAMPLLGALRLAAERAGLFSYRLGVGLMVLAAMLLFVVVIALTARRLNLLGRRHSAALERLARSETRLRRTLDHLLHVQETERRSLATDLHDDALPTLAAVTLQVELAQQRARDPEVRRRLRQAEDELRAGGARLRSLMFDLRPEALAAEGLGGALRHRLERMRELTGVDYELRDRLGTRPSPNAAAILYRIAVEALHNVAQHAQASVVRVELERHEDRVQVRIADDGVGMDHPVPRPGHIGLATMAERAELAGGRLEIDSRPGAGTAIVFWVPAAFDRGAGASVPGYSSSP